MREIEQLAESLRSGVFGTLVQRLPAAAFVIDDQLLLLAVEGGVLKRVSFDAQKAIGRNVIEVISRLQRADLLKELLLSALGGNSVRRLLTGFGGSFDFFVEPLRSAGGEVIGAIGLAFDVTEEQKIQRALRHNEQFLNRAQRLASLGNWVYDIRKKQITMSQEMYELYGFPQGATFNRDNFLAVTHPDDRDRVRKSLVEAQRDGIPCKGLDYRILFPDGSTRWVLQQIEVICDKAGTPIEMSGTILDITERKRLEEHLRQLAHFDTTTGLANRTFLTEHLSELKLATGGPGAALLFVDLDEFKSINDTHGHASGDKLLKEAARRISACLRREDFVARSGGDEFVLVLAEGTRETATSLAARIVATCGEPYQIGDKEVFCSMSIGISVGPEDATTGEQLLRNADSALYSAKTAGRNTFRFFQASMHAEAVRRLGLENDLRRAVEREQLFLAYQPVVATDGRIVSIEALLRWRHPIEGIVPPGTFIPLAEKSDTILQLGAWVARTAAAQIRTWRRLIPDLRIGLNVSARQFDDPSFAQTLDEALAEAGLDHSAIDIEVTESLVVNARGAIETLRELRRKGARVSIDDFGTGYSSLAALRRLPIDTLKIDRSFVEPLESDPEASSIATAIVAVARAMRLDVVAEGVETKGQVEILRQLGCDRFQGFLFSRPVGEDGMVELLEQGRINVF